MQKSFHLKLQNYLFTEANLHHFSGGLQEMALKTTQGSPFQSGGTWNLRVFIYQKLSLTRVTTPCHF
jgi:hypothetical protein